MTLLQRLMFRLLPRRWFDAIKAESQTWMLRCLTCGNSRSLWDAGGMRYKGTSHAKRTVVWCTECQQLRLTDLQRQVE